MDHILSRGADDDAGQKSRRRRKGATKEATPEKATSRKPRKTRTSKTSQKAPSRSARKKPEKGPQKPPDPLKREILGIAILGASLCLMLALGSFHLDDVDPQGGAASTGHTRNLIGPVGAHVADVLLYVLGLAAFLLPLTLALPGVFFIVGRRLSVKPMDIIGYPLLVLTGSMLAHLWMAGHPIMGHDAGGHVGTTGAEILKSLFGQTGAYIILYCVLALTFMLTTGISLYSVGRAAVGPLQSPIERLKAWWADFKSKRAEKAKEKAEARDASKAEKARAKAERAALKAEAREASKAEKAAAQAEKRSRKKGETIDDAEADVDTNLSPRVEVNLEDEDIDPPSDDAEPAVDERRIETDVIRRGRRKRSKRKSEPQPAVSGPRDTPAWAMGPVAFDGGESAPVASEEMDAAPEPEQDATPSSRKRRPSRRAQPVISQRPAQAEMDPFSVGGDEVVDFGDAGVDFDDPLDQAVAEGEQDTVFGSAVGQVPRHLPPAPRVRIPTRPPPPMDEPVSAHVDLPPPVEAGPPPPSAPPEPPPSDLMDKPVVKERMHRAEEPLIDGPVVEEEKPGYELPPLGFLDFERPDDDSVDSAFLQEQADRLVAALDTFKIQGRVTEIHPGPVVTMFEFEPAPGVRISKIAGLADDLAMALRAIKVRIVAPIPGKGVVGFEVPNESREMVYLKEIIGSPVFRKKHNLPIALGKDIHGAPVVADLARMPHLLVAGTTGSGKSVGVNCMIASMLYHAGPDEIRMIMVDPKMLELSIYEDIPHLLLPVVTDPKKAAQALKWAVDEMERRYQLMKEAGVRNLKGFNKKVEQFAGEAPLGEGPEKLPYIVVIIDEFADLMMVAGKEVEYCVARIAQKARAAGIHLILATQRPSTDVITGVIKANFPTRMAFQVSSGIDSRTILSTNGAENLLGKGDMLYMPPGTSRLTRVHGAFVSEDELHEVVAFIKEQAEPDYLDESVLATEEEKEAADGDEEYDSAYEDAVRVVYRDGRASTSHLQRRLSLGYNRAARIIDCMEREGLVGPGSGAKPRQIHKAVIADLISRWDGHMVD
ncbi:MAG: DNA translocase FtsK [Bradymonadia bacterium]